MQTSVDPCQYRHGLGRGLSIPDDPGSSQEINGDPRTWPSSISRVQQ